MGQYQTGDVLIVLFHGVERGPAGPAQVVVGQVQHRGPVGHRGEVSEARRGAVHDHGVGGGGDAARYKVVEHAGAGQGAVRVDSCRVDSGNILVKYGQVYC